MQILIVSLIISLGGLAGEQKLLKRFCEDSVFLVQLMKADDVLKSKALGKIQMDYHKKLEERPDLSEKMSKEVWEKLEEAKRTRPLWACEVEGVMPTLKEFNKSAVHEIQNCIAAQNPKSIVSDLSPSRSRPVHPDDLAHEIKETWKLALAKFIELNNSELKDAKGKNCQSAYSKVLKGAGAKYLKTTRPMESCKLMVAHVNDLQKTTEKCSR